MVCNRDTHLMPLTFHIDHAIPSMSKPYSKDIQAFAMTKHIHLIREFDKTKSNSSPYLNHLN